MKLSITQMVLGILILLAACYIVGWMIFRVSLTLPLPMPDESGTVKFTKVFLDNEILLTIARIASGILFGLALVVLLTGAFQIRTQSRKILAIAQIIVGILVTVTSALILTWGYPTQFIIPVPEGSNLLRSEIYINPGPEMIYAINLTQLSFLLGLAVLSVAIAQFIKARKG